MVNLDTLTYGGGAINRETADKLVELLTEYRPWNILEFGLGTSSIILHSWANTNKTKCLTVEGDLTWIDHYRSEIEKNDMLVTYDQDQEITVLDGRSMVPSGEYIHLLDPNVDFVFVDGPIGYPYKYPRIQVVDLIQYLDPGGFTIVIHDSQRDGEKNTIAILLEELFESGYKLTTEELGLPSQSCMIIKGFLS